MDIYKKANLGQYSPIILHLNDVYGSCLNDLYNNSYHVIYMVIEAVYYKNVTDSGIRELLGKIGKIPSLIDSEINQVILIIDFIIAFGYLYEPELIINSGCKRGLNSLRILLLISMNLNLKSTSCYENCYYLMTIFWYNKLRQSNKVSLARKFIKSFDEPGLFGPV